MRAGKQPRLGALCGRKMSTAWSQLCRCQLRLLPRRMLRLGMLGDGSAHPGERRWERWGADARAGHILEEKNTSDSENGW